MVQKEELKELKREIISSEGKALTGYATKDMPWLKYFNRQFSLDDIPNMSIFQLVEQSNKDNLDNVALDVRTSKNDFNRGIKITYRTYIERMKKSAKSSLDMGIGVNDIIPIILPNIPEARILLYSNSIVGATSYQISPLMPSAQLASILSENQVKNIFIFEQFYEKYSEVLRKSSVENIVLLDGTESLPTTLKALKEVKDFLTGTRAKNMDKIFKLDRRIVPWSEYDRASRYISGDITPYYDENHVAAIIGTSGTSGTSKGVCMSDKNINAVGCAYRDGNILTGNIMDALLPSIGYGISLIHYQTIDGKYVYLIPELLTKKFPDALYKLMPDNFTGGPVHFLNLRESNQYKNGQKLTCKNLISGGASLSKDLEEELNKVSDGYAEEGVVNNDIIVRQGYGLTENIAMGTYSMRGAYKFGSIGIPMPYCIIGIFKPGTDEELKYYEEGEICITGPTVMMGYLNNEEETNQVIKVHSDGRRWIHTKDIGYMDETGHIFFKDRLKNIFMRTGFNVHPSTISNTINSLPYVVDSVTIGFNDPIEQCVPVSFVVLNEEMLKDKDEEELRKEIIDYCYANLEETSVPVEIVFTNMLPINLGGKVDTNRIAKESEINLYKSSKIKKRIKFNV